MPQNNVLSTTFTPLTLLLGDFFSKAVSQRIAEAVEIKGEIDGLTADSAQEYQSHHSFYDYEYSIRNIDRNYIPEQFQFYYNSLSAPLQQKFKETLLPLQSYSALPSRNDETYINRL
jgi:hypothetical protein